MPRVTESCGYQGHICGARPVQAISRYRDQNDYCIEGHRVTLYDDGQCTGTQEQRRALALFLLDEYAEYLHWHVAFKAKYDPDAKVFPLSPLPEGWNS